MSKESRARVIFNGRVQGVCFRINARDTARRLGVKGWVRNLSNGTVEVVAEGDKAVVEELIAWCTHEQPMARVKGKTVKWEDPEGEEGFNIH